MRNSSRPDRTPAGDERGQSSTLTSLPEITSAERAVADLLPIGAAPEDARRVLARVPLWFHTFALNAEHGLYTPGVARDHRYRVPLLPASFAGRRVLDVGTFDGFYAYLAEHRGATRVVAVDNEQYTAWVKARWGVVLTGGEGFRAIGALLGSRVEYVRGDALTLQDTGERFDVIFCFGILHRVENPLGLMRALGERLAPGGRLLVETYGIAHDGRVDERAIEVQQPGGIYPGDEFVYWGFGAAGDRSGGRARSHLITHVRRDLVELHELVVVELERIQIRAPTHRVLRDHRGLRDLVLAGAKQLRRLRVEVAAVAAARRTRNGDPDQLLVLVRDRGLVRVGKRLVWAAIWSARGR